MESEASASNDIDMSPSCPADDEGEDSDDNKLLIDEPSPPKLPKLEINGDDRQAQDETTPVTSPSISLKPIQMILNRAKPGCHSTQTRYQTRTRSCSLPPRHSRYSSSDDVPFACDTKMSLIELANKLASADRRVNGKKGSEKRSPGRPTKPVPALNKATMIALKKKIQSLNNTDEDHGPKQLQLPASVIDPQSSNFPSSNGLPNGVGSENSANIQSPEVLSTSKYQVVKVDLFPKTPEKKPTPTVTPQKDPPPRPNFLQSDKVRSMRKSLEHAQKQEAMLARAEAKRREMECVKQLEAQRAKEKKNSEEAAKFNSMVYQFYEDVSKFMDRINAPPSDLGLEELLPKPEGLPVWPLLSATNAKELNTPANSIFQATIDNAIREGTPDKTNRKRDHTVLEENQEPAIDGDTNVSSGGLHVPEPLIGSEIDAIVEKAINHVLRHKIPKFAKRGFEAAKYAAETGKKHVLLVEEARKDREARGFGPPGLNIKPHHMYGSQHPSPRPVGRPPKLLSNKVNNAGGNYINVSPAPAATAPGPTVNSAPTTVLPLNFVPVQQAPSQPGLVQAIQKPKVLQPKLQVNPVALAVANAPRSDSPSDSLSRKHKCPECDYQTDNRSHLRRHVGSVHSDVKLFSCYVCNKEFARGEKCKAHIEKEHPEVVYDYRRIRRHTIQLPPDTRNISRDVPLDLSANAEKEPKAQVKAYEYGIMPAKHAHLAEGGAYEVKTKDAVEISKPPTNSSYQCPQCPYIGRDSWHLQRHLSEVHAAVRSLKCGICSYSTGRKHRMVSHMKKHGELFCFYCDFSTTNVTLFNSHLKLCTNIWRANMLTCDKCQRIYNSRKQLQIHLSKEHNVEMFFCDLCPYSTMDFQQFEKHSETHFSGDIESQCMKCNEIFDKAEELMEHNKSCTGNNMMDENETLKLKCSMCNFTSANTQAMQIHLNSHTEEKLLCVVEGCTFSARYETSMRQHMKYKHKQGDPKPDKPVKPPANPIQLLPASSGGTVIGPASNISASSALSVAAFAAANAMPPGSLAFNSITLPTIPIGVTGLPIPAIPVYAAPAQLQPTVPQKLRQPSPRPQTVKMLTNKQNPPKPAGYDDDSGGLKGHGSGTFVCPYCSDRPPFKYRRSYEKHMYKHQKDGVPNPGQRQPGVVTLVRVRCPFAHCQKAFGTNAEVEQHMANVHSVSASSYGKVVNIVPENTKSDDVKPITIDLDNSAKVEYLHLPKAEMEVIELDSSPEKEATVKSEGLNQERYLENNEEEVQMEEAGSFNGEDGDDGDSYMYEEGVDLDTSFGGLGDNSESDGEGESSDEVPEDQQPPDSPRTAQLKLTISKRKLEEALAAAGNDSSSEGGDSEEGSDDEEDASLNGHSTAGTLVVEHLGNGISGEKGNDSDESSSDDNENDGE